MGTRTDASEKGIGKNPTPNEVAIYLVAQLRAEFAFRAISTCWALLKAFFASSGMISKLNSSNSFNPNAGIDISSVNLKFSAIRDTTP